MQGLLADRDLVLWVFGLAALNVGFWVFRLAAFRKDRDAGGESFGEPPVPAWRLYNPANYVPAARWTFRIFIGSAVLFFVARPVTGSRRRLHGVAPRRPLETGK
jgi:hypothetical protein